MCSKTFHVAFRSKSRTHIFQHGYKHNPLSKARVAKNLVGMMPQKALDIIRGGNFVGGDLVVLKSEVHRPSFREGFQMVPTFFPV